MLSGPAGVWHSQPRRIVDCWDTAIIPGIEKYNLGDSIRLMQGVKKYDTVLPQEGIKVKYEFSKEAFTFLLIFYSFFDLLQNDKKSEMLFFERKRRKKDNLFCTLNWKKCIIILVKKKSQRSKAKIL